MDLQPGPSRHPATDTYARQLAPGYPLRPVQACSNTHIPGSWLQAEKDRRADRLDFSRVVESVVERKRLILLLRGECACGARQVPFGCPQ